jgi:hypothetical protein
MTSQPSLPKGTTVFIDGFDMTPWVLVLQINAVNNLIEHWWGTLAAKSYLSGIREMLVELHLHPSFFVEYEYYENCMPATWSSGRVVSHILLSAVSTIMNTGRICLVTWLNFVCPGIRQ